MHSIITHTHKRTGVKQVATIVSRSRMGYEITITRDGRIVLWDVRETLSDAIAWKKLYRTQMKNNKEYKEG